MQRTCCKIDLDIEFQAEKLLLLLLLFHCILLVASVKLFQETIGRNVIVLLKNGKKHYAS